MCIRDRLVDERGNMSEETPFAGLFVKKADPEVLKDLESRGLLYDCLLYTSRSNDRHALCI